MNKSPDVKNKNTSFLIAFCLVIFGFATTIYFISRNRIIEAQNRVEESTLNIAESYRNQFVKSKETIEIVNNLINDQVASLSQSFVRNDNIQDSTYLTEMALEFQFDEISLYTPEGELVFSNIEENTGWVATAGHPVHSFLASDESNRVDEIRKDTLSGEYKKFGYARSDDGFVVQVALNVDRIEHFYDYFTIQTMVDEIMTFQQVLAVFYTDMDESVTASQRTELDASALTLEVSPKENVTEAWSDQQALVERAVIQVNTPIYHNGIKQGTLSIVWPQSILTDMTQRIILNGLSIFLLIAAALSALFMYAFRKNQSTIHLAFFDELTGLPNGAYLKTRLNTFSTSNDLSKQAVFFIKCRSFKALNMTYGFEYTEKVIKSVSAYLSTRTDDKGTLFRYNSDTFALVVEDFIDKSYLETIAKDLIDMFEEPFSTGPDDHYINIKITIVSLNANNNNADRIIKHGLLGLVSQADKPDNQLTYYESKMNETILREDLIEKTLRKVIKNKQREAFHLEYQPKMVLFTNKLMGFEALARLNVNKLGKVSPVEFIKVAEKRMLIYDLGLVIIREACECLNRMHQRGYTHLTIAVNISILQLLREDFIGDVKQIIDSLGISAAHLEFEITETELDDDIGLINAKLADIKKLGITLSLDDFGTGFSSFSRLGNLNIDGIKIDKLFIDRIDTHAEDELITSDIISMSHKLGLFVVAEGIETDKQMHYLKKYKCDYIQGYLYSKPLVKDQMLTFIKENI